MIQRKEYHMKKCPVCNKNDKTAKELYEKKICEKCEHSKEFNKLNNISKTFDSQKVLARLTKSISDNSLTVSYSKGDNDYQDQK